MKVRFIEGATSMLLQSKMDALEQECDQENAPLEGYVLNDVHLTVTPTTIIATVLFEE